MSKPRSEILGRLRQALAHQTATEDMPTLVKQRLTDHPPGPLPAWSTPSVERFISKVEAAAGSIRRIDSPADIPSAVCDYLSKQDLPPVLTTAGAPLLKGLQWPPEMDIARREAGAGDRAALSVANLAIAETGSLVLLSSADTPTSLNFLPEHYICVLQRQRIVDHMEDAWNMIRKEQGHMPRAINMITGPSRTADVEQSIQLGAHGPRYLHVLLLDAPSAAHCRSSDRH